MTLGQQAQIDRFNASRSIRGVSLTLFQSDGKGPVLLGLVQPIQPEPESYAISKETRTFSMLYFLRSEITVTVGIGSVWTSSSSTYRVTRIDDNDIDVRIGYHCETSTP